MNVTSELYGETGKGNYQMGSLILTEAAKRINPLLETDPTAVVGEYGAFNESSTLGVLFSDTSVTPYM